MKIRRGADGSMPLSGFGPPTVADPQPIAATLTNPPIPTDSMQVQVLTTELVSQTTAPALIPVAESKKIDLEVSMATGKKLLVWPCPLCTESACTHLL